MLVRFGSVFFVFDCEGAEVKRKRRTRWRESAGREKMGGRGRVARERGRGEERLGSKEVRGGEKRLATTKNEHQNVTF